MPNRRFAILEHTLPDGSVHHDLLIDRPGEPENGVGYRFPKYEKTVSDTVFDSGADDPDAKALWAVRIDPPPERWRSMARLDLTPLPPHRRRYLTYEGPVSRGRGSVRQVAAGNATIHRWDNTQAEVTLDLATGPLHLRLLLEPTGADSITAHVTAATDS